MKADVCACRLPLLLLSCMHVGSSMYRDELADTPKEASAADAFGHVVSRIDGHVIRDIRELSGDSSREM